MRKTLAFILSLLCFALFLTAVGCANAGGGSGNADGEKEFTVEFKQSGKPSVIVKAKDGEKISEVAAPESEGEGLVSEWNFDFEKPVRKSETVEVISYTEGVSFALSFKGDGYTVSPYTGESPSVTLPDYYKGLPVTGISSSAFSGNNNITFVKMPAQLKTIGEHAFYYCVNLVSAEIPETVEKIGASAFDSCVKLVNFKLPPKLTVVSKRLTVGHTYSFIEVPEGVTTIEEYAFASDITSIVLPRSLEKIEFVGLWAKLWVIYYKGDKTDWSLIEISDKEYNGFSALSVTKKAAIYYYSEEKPAQEGNYWHYEDGNVVKW